MAADSKRRVTTEATFMAKSEQKLGSRSRLFPGVHLSDFLPDVKVASKGVVYGKPETRLGQRARILRQRGTAMSSRGPISSFSSKPGAVRTADRESCGLALVRRADAHAAPPPQHRQDEQAQERDDGAGGQPWRAEPHVDPVRTRLEGNGAHDEVGAHERRGASVHGGGPIAAPLLDEHSHGRLPRGAHGRDAIVLIGLDGTVAGAAEGCRV